MTIGVKHGWSRKLIQDCLTYKMLESTLCVLHINHMLIYKQFAHGEPLLSVLGMVGIFLKSKFSNTLEQRPTSQADLSKDNSHPAMFTLFCKAVYLDPKNG